MQSSTGKDSSDAFFNAATSPPARTLSKPVERKIQPTMMSSSRPTASARQGPPPPPPPPRSGGVPSSLSSSNVRQRGVASAATGGPPAPTARSVHGTSSSSSRVAPPRPASSTLPTSSYYSNPQQNNAYASTASAHDNNQNPTTYYGLSQPATAAAAVTSMSTATHVDTHSAETHAHDDDWYTAPAPAQQPQPWQPQQLPAQQQQPQAWQPQQQQQQQQNVINPYLLPSRPATHRGPSPSSSELAGAMDGSHLLSGPMSLSNPSSFSSISQPLQPNLSFTPNYHSDVFDDYANEPPLLEELGIRMDHILFKTRAVVLPFRRFGHIQENNENLMKDSDLAGPLVLALLLGAELLFAGKIHFAYIYGFGLFGCLSMTLVLNLMSPSDAISVWTVTSILGYALLPVNVLAFCKIFLVNLGKMETMGRILAVLTIAWCTIASTRLLEQGCGMRDQRYLVAYPIGLLYSAFVMITIF